MVCPIAVTDEPANTTTRWKVAGDARQAQACTLNVLGDAGAKFVTVEEPQAHAMFAGEGAGLAERE